eukprot:845406_1
MGGTVGRCSSDEPTHARQMNQKSDLLNAKILSACEPHYNIYNQWKIIASGCNELLCDIQTRLTYKRDALKLPKQINMWNKQTLKLEIIHHIERNGIISLKRIETLAEGVKNMKKKHFNEYVRDVAMSLPLISFTLPTTQSGSSDDDVPIYVRRIPVIPIIPSETTSADDSSSNDYTSSETDRYEDTSDYSSSDYSSFESSE